MELDKKSVKMSILLTEIQKNISHVSPTLLKGESLTYGVRFLVSRGQYGFNITATDRTGKCYFGSSIEEIATKIYAKL